MLPCICEPRGCKTCLSLTKCGRSNWSQQVVWVAENQTISMVPGIVLLRNLAVLLWGHTSWEEVHPENWDVPVNISTGPWLTASIKSQLRATIMHPTQIPSAWKHTSDLTTDPQHWERSLQILVLGHRITRWFNTQTTQTHFWLYQGQEDQWT